MVQKPKALKYKVITGYILLFCIAVASIWFFYTEIVKIAAPSRTDEDNSTIIKISNTIADLYASEALGRSAILTLSSKDHLQYNATIDSINTKIEGIKSEVEDSQKNKFDSIQILLQRKKNSINEIILFRKKNSPEKAYASAIDGIYSAKDSILSLVKPVKTEDRYEWQKLISALLTPSQMDSLSKLPVSNDSLAIAFDNILTTRLVKDTRQRYQLNRKEEKLLDENRIISDQLRVILSSIENDFLQKSYSKIRESQAVISGTVEKMAWIGAFSLFLLIVFAWIIIRDLTTNQNYRKQLELLNNENEELLRTKSMLMATVTHDLQTPLGSIIGFHDLIKSSGINAKQKQYLDNIKESTDYILKLVNDLLDFSKLENNRITIQNSGFNMKGLIEGICRTLEPIALKKNIELNWDIDEELNNNFLSDPYRIKQVLTNLISNSVKFTHEGSVEVTARQENNTVIISVLDTGIGIARERQQDVFKEFTQAHTGIEKKFGGTGLGLTISKKIIELLGGTINLESEEGQGSIFTVTIPALIDDTIPETTEEKQEDDIIPFLKNKKILLVDDDAVQLTLMRELFGNYPLDIVTENNPKRVLALLQEKKIDLLISDVQMPVMDGFELVKSIRSHEDEHVNNLPVIALSGRRDLTRQDYTSKGFTANHPKPVQFEQLIILISNIFGNDKTVGLSVSKPDTIQPLYNLKSLSQFTLNDPDSLKTIISTFIASVQENCIILKEAADNDNLDRLAETAHKMIPMLKQMEVFTIAEMLIPLEDRTLEYSTQEMNEYINNICCRLETLVENLAEEVNL
jgi:signal transduction histidine kinase/DNA-binding NarL/FixJ family response regulator